MASATRSHGELVLGPRDGRRSRRRRRAAPRACPRRRARTPRAGSWTTRRTPSLRAPLHLVRVAAHLARRRGGRPSSRRSAPSCAHSRATSIAVLPPPTTTTRPSLGRCRRRELHLLDPRRRADHARPVLARDAELRVRAEPEPEEHRVVLARGASPPCTSVPTSTPGPDLDAERLHPLHLAQRVLGVQLVRRDAGRVEAAGQRALLEDDRRVPLERQVAAHASDAGPAPDAARRASRRRFAFGDEQAPRAARASPSRSRSAAAARSRLASAATPCRRRRPRRAPRPGRRARTSSRGCSARRSSARSRARCRWRSS